ncbi:hypothetical protein C8J56DRAFT_1052322 [Mycena floridula]|nr:hypothetical protein C8J56DRAFT_1052322 [Mycena floridula]
MGKKIKIEEILMEEFEESRASSDLTTRYFSDTPSQWLLDKVSIGFMSTNFNALVPGTFPKQRTRGDKNCGKEVLSFWPIYNNLEDMNKSDLNTGRHWVDVKCEGGIASHYDPLGNTVRKYNRALFYQPSGDLGKQRSSIKLRIGAGVCYPTSETIITGPDAKSSVALLTFLEIT